MMFLQDLEIKSFICGIMVGMFGTLAVCWIEIQYLKRRGNDVSSKGEPK